MVQNRLLGASLLIAGTATGAAMLALPVSTGRAGFIPSLFVMCFVWAYLTYAAFCILEVAISLPKDSNLISMADHTLGRVGKLFAWISYLFLLYALNTAYIAGSTALFQDVIVQLTGKEISLTLCAIPLLALFWLLLRGGHKTADAINRLFMFGLIASFAVLLLFALPHIQASNLTVCNLGFVLPSISVVLTAFGYHVVIPSLVSYLHGDVAKLKKAIWIGSAVPLMGYILWQLATLGIVPATGNLSLETAFHEGMSGAELLAMVSTNPAVIGTNDSFAFFAIITSFLGVSLSLFDFLVDGLKQNAKSKRIKVIFLLAILPPLVFALSYKRAFLSALEYAGAYGVVILLALIPALMCWRKRYSLKLEGREIAPGGKAALVGFMIISVCFILVETCLKLGIFNE